MNEFSESLDNYSRWFLSAIKSSKLNDGKNSKILLQNCIQCFDQVSQSVERLNQPSNILKEFCSSSIMHLLFGFHVVRSSPAILDSEDCAALLNSVPAIPNETLFHTLKGLKYYNHLRGIVSWYPLNISSHLLTEFVQFSPKQTPLSLAISFELFFSFLYSLQFEKANIEDLEFTLEEYAKFMKVKFSCNKSELKLWAYHLFYFLQIFHLCSLICCKKHISEPFCLPTISRLKKLRSNSAITLSDQSYNALTEFMMEMYHDTCKYFESISFEIWLSWHSLESPHLGLSISESNEKKSIQALVSHTAFRILALYDDEERHILKDSYAKLFEFLTFIAVDPDYDVDQKLSNSELVASVEKEVGERRCKLLNILMSQNDIWNDELSFNCVKQYGNLASKNSIISIIERLIQKLKTKECDVLDGWKRVILELTRANSSEDIIQILERSLDKGQCDILKTLEFSNDIVQVFNRLSNQSEEQSTDSFIWLCLQSGTAVVEHSVEAVSSSRGLAPLVAQALMEIPFVCNSKRLNEENSFLIEVLNRKLDLVAASTETDRENEIFILMKEILKLSSKSYFDNTGKLSCHYSNEKATPYNGKSSDTSVELPEKPHPFDPRELIYDFVCPKLNSSIANSGIIVSLLDILNTVLEYFPDAWKNEDAKQSSLILCLVLILHNSCELSDTDASLKLSVTQAVLRSLYFFEAQVGSADSVSGFSAKPPLLDSCRETILKARKALSNYELHIRCVALLPRLLKPVARNRDLSMSQQLCFAIVEFYRQFQRKSFLADGEMWASFNLPNCTQINWLWSLFVVLPDCCEDEWLSSMYVFSSSLSKSMKNEGYLKLMFSCLELYLKVLILLCDTSHHCNSAVDSEREVLSATKAVCEEDVDAIYNPEQHFRKNIPIRHCFKAFSSSAMKFILSILKPVSSFADMSEVFIWWAGSLKLFSCDSELPCLLLLELSSYLTKLIQSEQTVFENPSFGNTKKRSKRKVKSSKSLLRDNASEINVGDQSLATTNIVDVSQVLRERSSEVVPELLNQCSIPRLTDIELNDNQKDLNLNVSLSQDCCDQSFPNTKIQNENLSKIVSVDDPVVNNTSYLNFHSISPGKSNILNQIAGPSIILSETGLKIPKNISSNLENVTNNLGNGDLKDLKNTTGNLENATNNLGKCDMEGLPGQRNLKSNCDVGFSLSHSLSSCTVEKPENVTNNPGKCDNIEAINGQCSLGSECSMSNSTCIKFDICKSSFTKNNDEHFMSECIDQETYRSVVQKMISVVQTCVPSNPISSTVNSKLLFLLSVIED